MARRVDELHKSKINTQQLKVFHSGNRRVAQQLALLGHGIKSPLTRIVALAELLLNEIPGKLNAEQKEYLQDIYNNSYLLMNSINSLLSISKSEAGYLSLNLSSYSIKEVVESVVMKVDSIAVSKGSEIIVDIPDNITAISFDRDKIEQILFNLLDNAIKFTRDGKITVRVKDDPASNFITVSVRDTGVGIEEKSRKKVFEKFYTEKNALNPGGSGLGLAVVKEFVELHRGRVWLESSPGQGTCVYFTLPKNLTLEKEGYPSHAGNY